MSRPDALDEAMRAVLDRARDLVQSAGDRIYWQDEHTEAKAAFEAASEQYRKARVACRDALDAMNGAARALAEANDRLKQLEANRP